MPSCQQSPQKAHAAKPYQQSNRQVRHPMNQDTYPDGIAFPIHIGGKQKVEYSRGPFRKGVTGSEGQGCQDRTENGEGQFGQVLWRLFNGDEDCSDKSPGFHLLPGLEKQLQEIHGLPGRNLCL